MKLIRAISFVFPLALAIALASTTQVWKQDSAGEFEKGTPTGITITSDGHLQLAPRVSKLFEASDPFFWAVTEDSKGRVFVAGGNNGKVYAYKDGKRAPIFDAPQIEVHALAVDGKDNLYVGTSPDGKIYRIAPDGSNQIFYSPGEKYIWRSSSQIRKEAEDSFSPARKSTFAAWPSTQKGI
jgi:outer membrane protein assembly factor BamB